MISKRGRPRKEDGKNSACTFRLSKKEVEDLDEMCKKTGKTRADIVREGLRIQYNLFKFR